MRTTLITAALLLSACSSGPGAETVCGQACEHLLQCQVSRIHITSVKSYGFDADCSGVACDSITACVSRCINAADCSALQSVALGGALHSCLVGCNSWFRVDGG